MSEVVASLQRWRRNVPLPDRGVTKIANYGHAIELKEGFRQSTFTCEAPLTVTAPSLEVLGVSTVFNEAFNYVARAY